MSDDSVRLDVWLDVACLFKTRSESQRACTGGKVEVNGDNAKPNRQVRVGDRLLITRPLGKKQSVTVKAVTDSHLPKAQARQMYDDTTPPPTPEEAAMRRMVRVNQAIDQAAGDKRGRREARKAKYRERGDW
ncbi:MAG: RNA-binding S4 domain-containing protein [Acidobacteriota bacterium]|nr:RNA-binding S4 domain-containing protein [Acidobacteriota bacterium]